MKIKRIGKAGLNIRLASMLTKYEIELVEVVSINSTPSLNGENNTWFTTEEKSTDTASLEALFK